MESGYEGAVPAASDATEMLAQVDRARVRAATMPSRRATAWLDIAESALFASFLLVYVITMHGPHAAAQPPMALVLVPFFAFSALAQGALARLGIRRRYGSVREWTMLALRIGVLVVFVAAVLAWKTIPFAAQVASPLVAFGILALPSSIVLMRLGAEDRPPRITHLARRTHLAPMARITTTLLGVIAGAAVVAAASLSGSLVVTLVAFLVILVVSITPGAAWGLSGVGAAWGRCQWGAFVALTAGQFAVAIAVAYTTPPLAMLIVIGATMVAVMAVAAFCPGARERSAAA